MEENDIKIKIVTSILHNRIKLIYSYEEYKELKNRNAIDVEYYTKLRNRTERFQVDLYNYARSILDKKSYFENSDKVSSVFDEMILGESLNGEIKAYKFSDLHNAFRNRSEHFDKIDKVDEYLIFKVNVKPEKFEELLLACDDAFNSELNKLTDSEMVKVLFGDVETLFYINVLIIQLDSINYLVKEQNPCMYNISINIMENLKKINFGDITREQILVLANELSEYLKNELFKNEFVREFGETMYNQLMDFYDMDNDGIGEYKKKLNNFFLGVDEYLKRINNNCV